MKKRIAGVCAAAVGVVALAVSPAFAATQQWAYASGQMKATATATCPKGMKMTGGGFQASEYAKVTMNSPEWDSESWTVSAVNTKPAAGDINVSAVVICV